MDGPVPQEGCYVFERFRLDPIGRELTCEGVRIPLAARLFDTLMHLVVHHGRLVTRAELMGAVWPARTVEETSLGVAISSVRATLKAYGAPETMIVTAPGHGYRFGMKVAFEPAAPGVPPAPPPVPPGALAGRRGFVVACAALIGVTVVLCVAAAWRSWPHAEAAPAAAAWTPPPRSIAVLPFTNMSGDASGAAFADGLAEELINALGRDGSLLVAARMSSFSFRDTPATIGEIARKLDVGLVLEGSVRRDAGRVRVIASLIDATTGFQIWSRSYERAQGDILALQGELAEAAIGSLKATVLPGEAARLTTGGTADARAFDAYLSGLRSVGLDNDDANRRAIADFTTAIALDPTYALAYAQRARAQAYLAANGLNVDIAASRSMLIAAQEDASHAIALAPELGEAHSALGLVLKFRLTDLARAGAEYTRAVELAPGDATILMRYGQFQLLLGHVGAAVEAMEHATTLDPLTPGTYHALARALAYGGQYDDALAALRRARSLSPADPQEDRIDLSFVQLIEGDARGAQATCVADREPHDFACHAWADYELGEIAAGDAQLARLRATQGDKAAYLYAMFSAVAGRKAEAIHWLQIAYRLRDPGLTGLRVDPMMRLLRGTAQYQEIERGLGFPP